MEVDSDSSDDLGSIGGHIVRNKKTASSRGAARVTSGGHKNSMLKRLRSDEEHGSRTAAAKGARAASPKLAPLPTQQDVFAFLNKKKSCCSRGSESFCCLERHFLVDIDSGDDVATVDTTKLYQFITSFRKVSRSKSAQELDEHVISEVRQCIVGSRDREPSTMSAADHTVPTQFTYEWKLRSIHEGYYTVCREVFAFVWGISVRQIKNAADSIKESEFGYCRSSKVKPLKDETRYFEEFSYDDVERIISENVLLDNECGTFEIGK